MTPDQIRQIAEEYARTQMDAYTESVIPIVQFIAERYCVVERCKVVEMYQQAQVFYEDSKEEYWAGQADFCEELFGSETLNKKEDD